MSHQSADSTLAGHRLGQQTCCATGAAAGVDFISIAPLRGASTRNCLRHLYLANCGREVDASTPQPWSRDKDAFLPPELSRTSRIPPPHEWRVGFHIASLIARTADTPQVCARQASRDRRTWNGLQNRSTRRRGLDAPDPGRPRAQ